jgi:acyl-CoA synthetase (AMP-forming)/AMP-acid ligase II
MHHASVDLSRPMGAEPPRSLQQLLRTNAERNPNAPCVVSTAGEWLTWRQLVDQLDRTSTSLRAFGFGPSDRIALVMPNGPVNAVAFLTVASCVACAPPQSGRWVG